MATTLDFQLVKTAGIRQTSSRMKRSCGFLFSVALGMLIYAQPPTARAQVAQTINVTSHLTPTPRPPMTAALATNILVWDAETKTIEVHEGEPQGHLAFTFTNVSTNNVVISNVHPGCGCTTAQLPPLPWTNAPGATGRIGVTINVHGTATLFKNLTVTTDKGIKTLTFYVHILPLVLPIRTENERANDIKIAQTNRQAIFQAQCALCHVKPGDGKYGKSLYDGLRHLPRRRPPNRPSAGFARFNRPHQRGILAQLDRPRQTRQPDAGLCRHRWRTAERPANQHPDPISQRRHSIPHHPS